MRFVLGLTGVLIAFACASTASAVTMKAEVTGYVIYGEDAAGFFGAAGRIYEGERYVATFIYDPDRADRITNASFDFARGGTLEGTVFHPLTPFLSVSLELNGVTKSFDPTFGFARAGAHDSLNFFTLNDAAEGDLKAQSYFGSTLFFDAFADLTAPVDIDLAPFPVGSGARWLRIADGEVITDADFVLQHESLRVAAIPEPATWALMMAGFGLAGATLRRARAVAA